MQGTKNSNSLRCRDSEFRTTQPVSSDTRIAHPDTSIARKPVLWLLSAYRADSHAAWSDWITGQYTGIHWHRIELPGRHFRWRIRSNPLSWLDRLPESEPDLILVTSMVDLATLKGLHPRLARVPTWCYFHENQFAYPESEHQFSSVDHQMVQIYTGLAADRLFFNSEFNRNTYLDGISELFRKKPDIETKKIRKRLEEKSNVLPIPVMPVPPAEHKDKKLIVWNHRWEYDKAPEIFVRVVLELAKNGMDFRLALLGDRSNIPHESLVQLRNELSDRIIIDEKADQITYRKILGQAGIAVSTAIHEFQGLAMLEAASAGARPLVPDSLCYPEQYPAVCRYPSGSHKELVNKLSKWLSGQLPPPVDVSAWSSKSLQDRWDHLFTLIQKNQN